PLAQVGELDPFAASLRDLIAREDLRLERSDQAAERLLGREDAQLPRLAGAAFPRAKTKGVACPEEHLTDREHPPAVTAELELDRLLLARGEVDRPRCLPVDAQLGRE